MRIEYDLTFDDFRGLSAARVAVWRKVVGMIPVGIFGILCLGVGFYGYRSGEVAGWWVLPALFAATVVGGPFLRRWEQWRAWHRAHGVVQPHVIAEFGGAGVFVSTGAERTFLQWNAFSHFGENAHLFLLYQGPDFFRYFPKRAFGGSDATAQFRLMLRDRIGATRYEPQRPGFAVVQPAAGARVPNPAESS